MLNDIQIEQILEAVYAEREYQDQMHETGEKFAGHPRLDEEIDPYRNLVVLMEEVGELAQAILEKHAPALIFKEAIQVSAVGAAIAEAYLPD